MILFIYRNIFDCCTIRKSLIGEQKVQRAKLQGFPSWWCKNLETENPSEDEISFWKQVFDMQFKNKARSVCSDQQAV